MWAAHDDLREPQALELLVAALDADPGAALALSAFSIIGPDGERVRGSRPWDRVFRRGPFWQFAYMIASDEEKSIHIYGLMRRDAARRAMADMAYVGTYSGNDICVLLHLLGQGRAAYVDRLLFHYRTRDTGQPQPSAAAVLERGPGLAVKALSRARFYSRAYLVGTRELFGGVRDVVRAHTRFGAPQRAALLAVAWAAQAAWSTRILSRAVRRRLTDAG
jgi:hypothetical protein